MKQFVFSLMIVLMSMMASTPAVAKNSKNDVMNLIPKNIVVKQTTQFKDGRTLVIYYKKQGTNCEVYSPCEAKDYDVTDASKIQTTFFEVVNQVEGKLYRKATMLEVMKLIKSLVSQYL